MRWLALCCRPDAQGNAGPPQVALIPSGGRQGTALPLGSTGHSGDIDALGWLALSFTPRAARLEEAVVAEVSSSLRLFRGARQLRQRLQAKATEAGLALGPMAWAPTALGALALARSADTTPGRLSERLDALPLSALSAAQAHHAMLTRLGCTRLGELRRLPRPALAKRFGPALLTALDQAYGDLPEVHQWLTLPDRFDARLELPYRVEHAPVLLHFAEVLLRQLCTFLAARHAGVRALRLSWQHDAMRARDVASSGELSIATADTTRDLHRLTRLLGEHLARTELAAPAGDIRLSADTLLPLQDTMLASLLPGSAGDAQERITANTLLERLSVRLGPDCVREGQLHEDHRLDRMQRWRAWPARRPRPPRAVHPVPNPPGSSSRRSRCAAMRRSSRCTPAPSPVSAARTAWRPAGGTAARTPATTSSSAARRAGCCGCIANVCPQRPRDGFCMVFSHEPPISDRDERLIDMREQGFTSDADLRRDADAQRQLWPHARPDGASSRSAAVPRYAELHCLTAFSFLRGASEPSELVERAVTLGYEALAINRRVLAGRRRARTQAAARDARGRPPRAEDSRARSRRA